MKIVCIILGILILLAVIFVILMHIDCVEVDPDSPLYNDEIDREGIEKFKIKKK